MKHPVLSRFRDRVSGNMFPVGSTFETDDKERAEHLKAGGFIGPAVDQEEDADGLKHVGRGVYELPNGDRVRGKDKALEALAVLEKGDPEPAGEPDEPGKAE